MCEKASRNRGFFVFVEHINIFIEAFKISVARMVQSCIFAVHKQR